ncbi:MAG TPA: diguanylate cyclase [Aromatoleum sp.]|uniref:diguanylate cyclase domain-containing protein n=1 Tax=Aromatoleum sp. TaxID=2307007 RepID=UPI002B4782EC|nr:diguanylate cyclase [Aromatoleum sp.]HJV25996.1 diguanylate cyclase [Aromatoleum sp.]
MTDRTARPLPRVLLVDTDPQSQRMAALSNAGFPVQRVDDVRAVKAASARCKAEVVVHMAAHFAPSAQSAFETTLSQVSCPVIVLDDQEDRGLDFVLAGAADLVLIDHAGLYVSQLIQRLRVAVARRGQIGAGGDLPDHIAKLIENMPCGALLCERDGRIVAANEAAERVTGVRLGDAAPWYAKLDPSLDVAARMQGAASVELPTALFLTGQQDQSRVELHARRMRGLGSDDERWLVMMRDLAPGELAVRQQLESERARRLVEYGGDILLLHDTEGRIVDVNHQATVQTGYTRDELLNLRIWDLDREARPGAGIWARLAAGGALTVEGNIRRKDGSLFPVEVKLGAWEDRGEKQIVAWLRDITERRNAEESQRLASIVFDSVSEGIMVADGEHRIVAVNPAFTSITEFPAGEATGRDDAFLFSSDTHDETFTREIRQAVEEHGRWEGEVWSRTRSGGVFPEWLSISAVRNYDGRVDRVVSVFTNITERKRLEEMMQKQAFHDPLTGLANRLLFHQKLKSALQTADERHNHVALLYIDLDRFKPVNDQYGHHAGDLLLKQVAERLVACGRRSDTVARLGGDEFAMILTDVDRIDPVMQVPTRVLEALKHPFDLDGVVVEVSGSVGITFYPDHCRNMEQLLRFADIAMYKAKENRGEVRVFDASLSKPRACG